MADWYVDVTAGDDVVGDGSELSPFATIQKAVDEAATEDVIYIRPGEYKEQVEWVEKGLSLIGHGGRAILDGEGVRDYCIQIGYPSDRITFKNLDITGSVSRGIDVYTTGNADDGIHNGALIENCRFYNAGDLCFRIIDGRNNGVLAYNCSFRGSTAHIRSQNHNVTSGTLRGNLFYRCYFEDSGISVSHFNVGRPNIMCVSCVFNRSNIRQGSDSAMSGAIMCVFNEGRIHADGCESYIAVGNVFNNAPSYAIDTHSTNNSATTAAAANAFYNSGSDNIRGALMTVETLELEANPFIDPDNGNFNLNDVEGGGAVLRALNFQLPSIATTVWPFGAWYEGNGGGGGSIKVNPFTQKASVFG